MGLQIKNADSDPQIGNLAVDACSVGLDLYHIGQGGCQIGNYRFAGNRTHCAWRGIPILGRARIDRALQIANAHWHGDVGGVVWPGDPDLLQIGNLDWK